MLLAQYVCYSDGAMIFIFRYVYGSNNKGSCKSSLITQFAVHKVKSEVAIASLFHQIQQTKDFYYK